MNRMMMKSIARRRVPVPDIAAQAKRIAASSGALG
jgi:hypothetical protein